MEHLDELSQIEARAKALGLSLTSACLGAGIYPHYVSRWRKPGVSPTLASWNDFRRKMNVFLDRKAQEKEGVA